MAITGAAVIPVLENLAADTEFKGLALVEVTPSVFFSSDPKTRTKKASEWVEQSRTLPFLSGVDVRLRTETQIRLVTLQPTLNPFEVVWNLLSKHRLPDPPYAVMRPDRFRVSSYKGVATAAIEQRWLTEYGRSAPPLNPLEYRDLLKQLKGWVGAIQARGGRVVFVRMVSSGPLYELEERLVPRARYWDPMLADEDLPGIHFKDLPHTAELHCPDGSHLDAQAAQVFARALAAELLRRGYIAGAP